KGHVPQKILEGTYGKNMFYEEAINGAFPKYYSEILEKEKDIYAVDNPDIDIEKIDDTGVILNAAITVKPDIKIKTYKGIKVGKKEYKVVDADIDQELNIARERAARLMSANDRPAKEGDSVTIDYSGTVDGVKFEGGSAQNQMLVLGSKTFIPGFEDQIAGMKVSDKKDIKVTFPKEYAKDLAGKKAVFSVELKDIKFKELPELNDEFAKDVSEFDTLAKYKDDIKKKLKEQNDKRAETEYEDALLDAILKETEVDIPKCMIEDQLDAIMQEMERKLMYQGLKFDDYLKYMNTTLEDFRKGSESDALKAVKTRLIFQEIIKLEKVEADSKSIDAVMEKMAKAQNKTLAEFKKGVGANELPYYKNQVISDKLFDLLKKYNP
ncbi:MAG: trigger factor, partial [Firmicutes bacterium]|nr:trigger factor [Bacillota bacterium]